MNLISPYPVASIVTADQTLVEKLLSMNTHNRSPRAAAVSRLADEIRSGAFLLTASGVGVSKDGVLLDGQHRLLAMREAGYPPVQFVLVLGLQRESQAVVDRHAKRRLADALSLLHSRTINNSMVAAANSFLAIKNSTHRSEPFTQSNIGVKVSDHAAMENVLEWEDDISLVLSAVGSSFRASVVAALAVYARHDKTKALELCDQLKRKVGLQVEDPAYRLAAALSSHTKGGSQENLNTFKLTASAVIAHASGRKIKLLRPSESWANAPWKQWLA